jgi:hypothetical protein
MELTVTAGEDGLFPTTMEDAEKKGYICIESGLDDNSGDDGIKAETSFEMRTHLLPF